MLNLVDPTSILGELMVLIIKLFELDPLGGKPSLGEQRRQYDNDDGESSAMTPGSSSSNDVPSSMGREECYRELESMGIECDKFNEFLEGRIVQELPSIIDLLRFAGSNNPDPAVLNLLVAALSSGAGIPTSMGTVDEIKHK